MTPQAATEITRLERDIKDWTFLAGTLVLNHQQDLRREILSRVDTWRELKKNLSREES